MPLPPPEKDRNLITCCATDKTFSQILENRTFVALRPDVSFAGQCRRLSNWVQ